MHLYDVEKHPVVDIPALALIDYSNQIEQRTSSTASTAFFHGLTLGMGALGGGAITTLGSVVPAKASGRTRDWRVATCFP